MPVDSFPRQPGAGLDMVVDAGDPDDKFRIWMRGETYPRVVLEPSGAISTGNGTAEPVASAGAGPFQPLAAVTPTDFGKALLALANAAALRSAAELGSAALASTAAFDAAGAAAAAQAAAIAASQPLDATLTALATADVVLPTLMPAAIALTDGANIATNAALGTVFKVTLGGNRTMDNPSNPTGGQRIVYRIKQDGSGSRLITWDTQFRFGVDVTTPVLTTTAAKTDYITFAYNADDTKWDCVAIARGY